MHLFNYFSAITFVTTASYAATTPFCKRDPSSAQWPSAEQWQALNTSVAGALRVPSAPGSVCHTDQPDFNNDTCTAVLANWTSTDWVAQSPWIVDYNDDTCLPDARTPCSTAGYPAYAIEAGSAADVAAGVKFASDNQVRLIVKATGHDYPGRSSGPGSLSIWTHNLRGVEVTMNDSRAVQYGGVASVKIAAGMRFGEIYTEAVAHNLTVVGGADPGVGIGGWVSAGGHGPLSAWYGMGSDQVLEMEVVTPDGEILTINEANNTDLFWAMRGAGGSTFAVLLSVTVKAYPVLPVTWYLFSYNTTVDSDTFWAAAAHFHADLPRLSEAGAMGYYYFFPLRDSAETPQGQITGVFLFPEKSEDQVKEITSPLEQAMNNNPLWASDKIYAGGLTISDPYFLASWLAQNKGEQGGASARLGSWLLDAESLTANVTNMATQLRKAFPAPNIVIGHLVAGPGTRNVTIPGGSSAVLPAWRQATAHVAASRSWTPLNIAEKNEVTRSLREEVVPILKSLAPESGAYINEADPTNPDWKNDYFGTNYEQLLATKKKWDPQSVFWCKPCVGHDEWEVVDGPAKEDSANWGVSQVGGKICQKQ